VAEYLRRLWKELVAVATATTIVAALVGIFTKGGLFLPLTAGAIIFLVGFSLANVRAVLGLQRERDALAMQATTGQADITRLTSQRDDARRERDVARTALTVIDIQTGEIWGL